MKLKGKVFEIGNLSGHSGRGMCMECDGDDFSIIGMTEEECREAVKWYGKEVEITIVGAGEMVTPNVEHNRRTAASSPGVRVDGPVGPLAKD